LLPHHKCIIFRGLVTHIAYLPLFGDVKAIKMIVLQSAISAALFCAQIPITECRTQARDKQLVITTMAATIIVVHIVGALFNLVAVAVCVCLILRILTALVIGMLAVDAMQMAWLVELTLIGRGLMITPRVLVARATSFKVATIAVASRPAIATRPAIVLVMPCTAVVVLLAFQEPLGLFPVTLIKLVAKRMLGSRTKLLIVLPLDRAIADTSKKSCC
jgi:hypothetical protein